MKRTATFIFSFAFILIVSSLAFGQTKKLADTRWKLIEAERTPVTNSSAFIAFDRNARQMTGNTGCNIMNGPVTVRGSRIAFGPIITTKRMCKLMEGNVGEGVYTDALRNARSFTRSGDVLRLYDRRGRKVLEFTRMIGNDSEDDDVSLEDRKWVLEQIKGRQTFVALPYAFVNFDERRHGVGGDSSCNAFGGEYSVVRNSISIKNVISTMRACVEDNKMNVEREMLAGLRMAKRFEIRDERLYLYRGNELLLTFRGEDK